MNEDNISRQLGAILDVLGLQASALFEESREAGKDRDKVREAGKDRDEVVAWLYRVLDTLDSKTAQLLSFVALLLAAETFLAQVIIGNGQSPRWISILVLGLLVLPAYAAYSGLTVFAVKWLFFGHVRPGRPNTTLAEKLDFEMRELARVCDERVAKNWRCYVLCKFSIVGFGVMLALALLVTFRGPHS